MVTHSRPLKEKEQNQIKCDGFNRSFKDFLDYQFSNYTKSDESGSSLIDEIAQRMPFQNKATIIPQACQTILTARGKNYNNRPLIAVTRGSGCGKSKLLEEL